MTGKKTYHTLLVLYIIFGPGVCTKNLRYTLIAKKVLNGYYCPSDTQTFYLSHVPRHVCTHYCVSEVQCSMMSYHVNRGICMIHKENCVVMVQSTEQVFSYMMLYRQQNHGCISWLPYGGSIPEGQRLVHNLHYIMVRIHYNSEILSGKLTKNRKVKTVSLVNGPVKVYENPDSAVEFLVVSDTCSVSWVPYIAGNPMPPRAVVGGRKWNDGPLVMAALWTTAGMIKRYSFGYYDPDSQLGYAYNGGPASNNSIDIMVEI